MPTWMPSLLNMLPLMTGLLVRGPHRERCAHRPAIARAIEPPELHNLPPRLGNRPHEIHQQRISVELINLTFLRTGHPRRVSGRFGSGDRKGLADPSHV